VLQQYLANIEHNIKVHKEREEKNKEGDADNKEAKPEGEEKDLKVVDKAQIKAVVSLIDELNNIIAKNFAVYGQYDDFSFANTRSFEALEEKLDAFFRSHFSGDF
jgi:hypothetical protein